MLLKLTGALSQCSKRKRQCGVVKGFERRAPMKKLIAYGIIHGKKDRVIRSQLPKDVVESIRLRVRLDQAKRKK